MRLNNSDGQDVDDAIYHGRIQEQKCIKKSAQKIDGARETIDVCLPYPPGPDEFGSSGFARR